MHKCSLCISNIIQLTRVLVAMQQTFPVNLFLDLCQLSVLIPWTVPICHFWTVTLARFQNLVVRKVPQWDQGNAYYFLNSSIQAVTGANLESLVDGLTLTQLLLKFHLFLHLYPKRWILMEFDLAKCKLFLAQRVNAHHRISLLFVKIIFGSFIYYHRFDSKNIATKSSFISWPKWNISEFENPQIQTFLFFRGWGVGKGLGPG